MSLTMFLLIFSRFISYLKASSFSETLKFYFIYFTFILISQPFFTELREVFGVQSNVCDGESMLKWLKAFTR